MQDDVRRMRSAKKEAHNIHVALHPRHFCFHSAALRPLFLPCAFVHPGVGGGGANFLFQNANGWVGGRSTERAAGVAAAAAGLSLAADCTPSIHPQTPFSVRRAVFASLLSAAAYIRPLR